jgi:hypothetical protein
MINNDNEDSTDTVTTKSKTISSDENNSIMSSTVNLSNPSDQEQPVQIINEEQPVQNTNEEKSVQNTNNDLNEEESQDNQLEIIQKEEEDDDEFIRITAAHQMLTEGKQKNFIFLLFKKKISISAQTYDEQKNFPAALHLYRICVDLLLEELMFTEGTDQSRVYLREKCTAIMDRIDVLKTMLDPIPPPPASSSSPPPLPLTTTNEQTTNPPTDELNSLHLS